MSYILYNLRQNVLRFLLNCTFFHKYSVGIAFENSYA